jgi:hypothetical protein
LGQPDQLVNVLIGPFGFEPRSMKNAGWHHV